MGASEREGKKKGREDGWDGTTNIERNTGRKLTSLVNENGNRECGPRWHEWWNRR